jgi:uncharacterized protein (TIGR03084 family)
VRDLIIALRAEQEDLDRMLDALDDPAWDTMTPAEPWTIRDTISHLAFFDESETQAISDPEAFANEINERLTGGIDSYMALGLDRGRSMTPSQVLTWWRAARAAEVKAFEGVDPDTQLPWYGPPMKAPSAVVARLMETWAHGHDVTEALGLTRAPTERLFHIAELGVKTFSWSYINRGLEVPAERVRVALRGPSGRTRVWNDQMSNSITGPVDEFCLVVAQRRNYLDTSLVIEGEVARSWMEVAQIFAGPPGPGRPPVAQTAEALPTDS